MVKRLPPGRSELTRDEVAEDQKQRMFDALAAAMAENGYTATTVADVIKGAGVSRHTFYEQFDSKQDCFMAGYARMQQQVVGAIGTLSATGTPADRFDAMLRQYLETLACDAKTARLYLVEIYAAGPDAMATRLGLQRQFVDGVIDIFRARTKKDRFACQALVAAISTLVTHALIDGDGDDVLALYTPLTAFSARLGLGSVSPSGR